jgi:DNA-binding beta-propeller fold protein YncE
MLTLFQHPRSTGTRILGAVLAASAVAAHGHVVMESIQGKAEAAGQAPVQPWGLAHVPAHSRADKRSGWLMTDVKTHSLYFQDPEGRVERYLGKGPADRNEPAYAGGFQDRDPEFRAPQSMAVQPWTDMTFIAPCTGAVADTGNHAIRMFRAYGKVDGEVLQLVHTLGGGAMTPGEAGQAGYRDGKTSEALFKEPRGLAWCGGDLYVADSGNGAIRRVHFTDSVAGEVSTLAGNPEDCRHWASESDDPKSGRLHTPVGLAADPDTGTLYTTDGHCVVEITREGRVIGLLGNFFRPGFEAWKHQPSPLAPKGHPAWMLGKACLNSPTGLAFYQGHLFIADTGNNAIRVFNLKTGILTTLAGRPGEKILRCGQAHQGGDYLEGKSAAIPAPVNLAIAPDGEMRVATAGGDLVRFTGLAEAYGPKATAATGAAGAASRASARKPAGSVKGPETSPASDGRDTWLEVEVIVRDIRGPGAPEVARTTLRLQERKQVQP